MGQGPACQLLLAAEEFLLRLLEKFSVRELRQGARIQTRGSGLGDGSGRQSRPVLASINSLAPATFEEVSLRAKIIRIM